MEFEVTDPNTNKTLVLTGDSPPNEQELEEIFSTTSDPIRENQEVNELTTKENIFGGIESFTKGGTLGFSDEIESVIAATVASPFVSDKTFSQLMVDARNSLRDDNNKFKEANPKTALGLELAGGVFTGGVTVNATKEGVKQIAKQGVKEIAKTGAKVGAGVGAVTGAGLADAEEFISLDTAIETAVGAGIGVSLGVALPLAINKSSEALKELINKQNIQIFDDVGKFTDEALTHLDNLVEKGKATAGDIDQVIAINLQKSGVLNVEQAKRFNLFQSRGITPTRANVTQGADDFIDQQSAIKRSGAVADTVAEQDKQLINTVTNSIYDIKPIATDLVETNANVFKAVDDVVTVFDDAVSKAYQVAKTESQGLPLVTFDNLADAISKNRGKEKISGGIISAIKQTMKNKGLIKKGSDLNINRRSAKLSGDDVKKLTVKEAEEIRQELDSLFDGASPQGRKLIRDLKDALDNDVASAVGEDVFADARLAKVRFHELIDRGSRNKFDKSRGGFLEDVINNKIPEEKILTRLLGGRDDDLIKMKQFLTKDSGESGVQAWNDIRSQVIRNALNKATGTAGKSEGGQPVFNVRLFKNEFNRLRNSKKFNELFNPDEQAFIDDIIEIGNLRVPISGTHLGTGASGVAVERATNEIIKRIPIIGDKAVDLVQALKNIKTDNRLLNVTHQTEKAINR